MTPTQTTALAIALLVVCVGFLAIAALTVRGRRHGPYVLVPVDTSSNDYMLLTPVGPARLQYGVHDDTGWSWRITTDFDRRRGDVGPMQRVHYTGPSRDHAVRRVRELAHDHQAGRAQEGERV